MENVNKESFYNEETKIVHGADEIYVPDPKGIGHAFYRQMRRNRCKIGQYNIDNGEIEIFGDMLIRCMRTSIAMRLRGVEPGNIISICAPNSMDNYIPYIAAHMTGAVVASLDPSLSLFDSIHLLKQVNPKIIFVGENSEELIESAIRHAGIECEIIVIGESNKYTTFIEFSSEKDDENSYAPHEVDDLGATAVILFSSGTTGLSKGICINHYGLFHQAYVMISSGGDVFDRMLTFATTYWVSAVTFISVCGVFGKCTCVMTRFSPKELWNILGEAGITYLFLPPSAAIMMLKVGRPDGIDTTSLRDMTIGGGPLSTENNLALRDLLPGTNVHILYGQSEAAGVVTMFRMADRRDVLAAFNNPVSSGRPIFGFQYKIVDLETKEVLGPNISGELRYKYRGMMSGYYNLDSSDAFDEDGWIKSGDIAYFDENLCFFIVDRIKEMLKYQGFHVPPAKLEGVLNSHPEVASSVVIGVPDEDDGDHAMGLVLLQPGATVTEDELIAFVNERVSDRDRLRAGIRYLNSFPYTPSGKIKKNSLKKMILSGEL